MLEDFEEEFFFFEGGKENCDNFENYDNLKEDLDEKEFMECEEDD